MDLEATSSTTSEGLDLASRLQGGEQPSSNCSMPVTKIEDLISVMWQWTPCSTTMMAICLLEGGSGDETRKSAALWLVRHVVFCMPHRLLYDLWCWFEFACSIIIGPKKEYGTSIYFSMTNSVDEFSLDHPNNKGHGKSKRLKILSSSDPHFSSRMFFMLFYLE